MIPSFDCSAATADVYISKKENENICERLSVHTIDNADERGKKFILRVKKLR